MPLASPATALHRATDPIVCRVLDQLTGFRAGGSGDPRVVRQDLLDALQQADAAVGGTREWELARYALVAWIDEVFLDADWPGQNWWSNNVLEVELFRSRDGSELFYHRAEDARRLPDPATLEVFYQCVVLGFRGRYREDATGPAGHGLPDTLAAWLRRTALAIEKKRKTEPEQIGQPPSGAAPRTARRWLVASALVLLGLLAVDMLIYRLAYSI